VRMVAYSKGCLASLSAKELDVGDDRGLWRTAAEHKSFDFRPLRGGWALLEVWEKRRVRLQ
jgi:hypothetical protein